MSSSNVMEQASTQTHQYGLPRRLQAGDRLCVIATSGTVVNRVAIERGIAVWQQRGYRVEVPATLDRRWGYFAGTDQQRLEQLYAALQDPDCRAILCAR
ncbi:MAG: LD-carboxypeptidase, partial [Cyanobacteria bacterium]|nr:LD-carboxypeptidase [Cyanobacteriota bacterium]MDW8200380.1 LD-carboxypeptidase [Cyanobacteriota bacterium SKYGB_h_bin112]